MSVEIRVYCSPELKKAAGEEADRSNLPLSEFVAQKLAEAIGKPEFSAIPRKPVGRPRKEISLAHTG